MVLVSAGIGILRIEGEEGMFWQSVRFALVAGLCLAGTAVSVRADDADAPTKEAPAAPAKEAPAAPATCKVRVHEWVPEHYEATRTCYRMEQREETYTAYKMVPEVQKVTRTVCVCVPCVEERTVMQAHWTCKPVTKIVRKCVDQGHWECREVPCRPTLRERLRKLCGRDCCDECPRTKIEKVWVKCPVWVETPVTCIERVCEYKPVTCKVTVYRTEKREETCEVTVCKCVPCKATRTVCVCVPHQEKYTACRMVCRVVEKDVPVVTCCTPCCEPCCVPAKRSKCCR